MVTKLLRVLVGKIGLDGHDRGAKIIARMLRDNGMEVIYTGIRQTPSMVTRATLEEDVDLLEDLILAAHNDAKSKLKQKTSEEISKVTGGIDLPPGFKFPL